MSELETCDRCGGRGRLRVELTQLPTLPTEVVCVADDECAATQERNNKREEACRR